MPIKSYVLIHICVSYRFVVLTKAWHGEFESAVIDSQSLRGTLVFKNLTAEKGLRKEVIANEGGDAIKKKCVHIYIYICVVV